MFKMAPLVFNMSLKKIKRAEKKGTESVMDEKFALLFWSEFSIGNGEYHYQVNLTFKFKFLQQGPIFYANVHH